MRHAGVFGGQAPFAVVQVANRDGERIGRVVRLRDRVEAQQHLHHLRDLRLLGAAVADDGALDLRGRVFDHHHAGLDRGEHRDAARVPELQRAARVDRVENVFDGDALGPVLGEQRRELAVDDRQLIGKRGAGPGAHGAAPNQLMTAAVAVDAAVTGAVRAGVDAEDPHASEASISFSSMSKFDQTCLTSS